MTLTDWSSSHFLRVLGAWIYIEQKGHMVKVHYHCFTQNCPVLQEAPLTVLNDLLIYTINYNVMIDLISFNEQNLLRLSLTFTGF
jgi:hypothetical protein